jgi:adenylate cyclase
MGVEIERKFLVDVQSFLVATGNQPSPLRERLEPMPPELIKKSLEGLAERYQEPLRERLEPIGRERIKAALERGRSMVASRSLLSQGYLSHNPWVRIRIADGGDAWITIKGPGAPESPEWEYSIPSKDAREMYDTLCKGKLTKLRRKVEYEGHVWDVDEFMGSLMGLWLAEIELKSLDEPFAKPPWLGEEVTGDHQYSNGWLAENGIPPRKDKELDDLIAKATAAYDALSPEEKRSHRREQAISWVYGQVKLSGTVISLAQVEEIVDDMIANGQLLASVGGAS